jgi:phosphoserine phosphatase
MKRYDLVAFDMDGVLLDHTSSWTWVHDKYGVNNDESLMEFLGGKINEKEFMRRDVALWKNIDPDVNIRDISVRLKDVPLISGIQETVAALRWNGIVSVIISGGIDIAAKMLFEEFGFDDYAANALETDSNGRLTGEGMINVDLTDKGKKLIEFTERFGTVPERTVSIGNSCTDIKMFENSGLSIAFNPIDDVTAASADRVVRSDNISDVLGIILGTENGI